MLYVPSRRSFIKGIAGITATGLFPNLLLAQGANKKLGIACIGVLGKGESDASGASNGNEIVAICDVDKKALAKAQERYPNAKAFSDFRKMLDEVKSIDAVTVSTPDHMHYPAAMHAIGLGKHVFVQKPLTNTLWENRELHLAARKKGVITQMGNQGHTYEGNRVTTEWIKAGAIGKVKEVHVWTNRPIWPQGSHVKLNPVPTPEELDWTQWLGQAPDSPFAEMAPKKTIHPFNWRGMREYGAGAFGDMGCHLMDGPYVALGLTVPQFVTATQVDDLTDVAWPTGGVVKLEYTNVPGHGDVVFYWYEGKKPDGSPYLPEFPSVIDRAEAFPSKKAEDVGKTSPGGWFITGTEGVIFNRNDQAKDMIIFPKARRDEFPADKIAKTEARSVKPGDPQAEWSEAIKAGKEFPYMSHFDYACPITEATLIGGLAMNYPGKRLAWDSKALKVTNHADANKHIKRAVYRKGWEYSSAKV
jgi:predicted dehydrogenase